MNESMQRGQLAVKNKNIPESIEWFSKAVKESPKDPQVLACLGQSLCWQGDLKDGLRNLHQAGQLLLKKARKTRDIKLVLDLTDQLFHWSDYAGAKKLCKQAVQIDPKNVRSYQFLALTYTRSNEKKNALLAAKKALSLAPGSLVLEILTATTEIAAGLSEQARQRLEKILQNPLLKPEEKFRAHKELARVLDKLGIYDQVFIHLHSSAEASKQLPEVKKVDAQLVPKMLETYQSQFDQELLERWKNSDFSEAQTAPVFVLGFMRTGTTLTQEVLGAHPDIFIADETDLVSGTVKELNRMFKGQGNMVEQIKSLEWKDVLHLREFYWQRAVALYGDKIGNKLLLDKTTMNSIDLGFISCIFPDAKLVFLLRDPRDICLSCMMQTMTPNPSTVPLLSWQGTAQFYAQVMEWWQVIKPKISMDFVELRYEDAVFNFEPTFRKVFDFLALEWNPGVADFHKSAATKYIASPSFEQVSKPLYSSSVGRWKNYESEYEEVMETLRPYIELYHY